MNPKTKRAIKVALMAVSTATLCDLCGGEATTCVYDGIKNGEPVTVGSIETGTLIADTQTLVQWGS